MIIIANLKNKLDTYELDNYIKKVKDTNVKICVPQNYIIKNYKNGLLQNFNEINDIYKSNCMGAIIGHFEFNENLDSINKKLQELLKEKCVAVVCFGEQIIDGDAKDILKYQIDKILSGIYQIENVIFAYEPLWAIGGTKKINIEYVSSNIKYIKDYILSKYNFDITCIYGGSVNKELIEQMKKNECTDGFLISTYALDYKNIINIC